MNENKLPRREFLANLLFAGGILTVSGLQSEYGLVARKEPEKDGWEVPDLNRDSGENTKGWEIPEDYMKNPPQPNPSPPPQPPCPMPRGRVVAPPPLQGKVVPPAPGNITPPRK